MVQVPKTKHQRDRHFIKEWRKFRRQTQEQVAERVGMSRVNFGKIENRTVAYSQDTLEKIAYALSCETYQLLSHNPTGPDAPSSAIDDLKRLDPETRGIPSAADNAPAMEMRELEDGTVWLRVNQAVRWRKALEIFAILNDPDADE